MNKNEKVLAMVIAGGADVNRVDFLGCRVTARRRTETRK